MSVDVETKHSRVSSKVLPLEVQTSRHHHTMTLSRVNRIRTSVVSKEISTAQQAHWYQSTAMFCLFHMFFIILVVLLPNFIYFAFLYITYNLDDFSFYTIFSNYFYLIAGCLTFYSYYLIYVSTFHATGKCESWCLCIAFYVLLNGTGLMLVNWQYYIEHDDNDYIFKLGCGQIFQCRYLTFYNFYINFLLPYFTPLLHCLFLIFLFRTRLETARMEQKHNSNALKERLLTDATDTSVALTPLFSGVEEAVNSSIYSVGSVASDISVINEAEAQNTSDARPSLLTQKNEVHLNKFNLRIACWLLVYLAVWALFGFIIYFVFYVDTNILTKYWDYCYMFWLLVTTGMKWILQKIARGLDIVRVRCVRKTKRDATVFSVELQTEILLSMIYWQIYRQYVAYYLINLRADQYAITILLHIGSELTNNLVRMSKFYFDKSALFQEYLLNSETNFACQCCGDCRVCTKCEGYCEYVKKKLYDNSTYDQWIMKGQIYIVIRFLVSFATAAYVTVFIFIVWENGYHFDEKELNRSLLYLVVGLICEVISFVVVHWIHLTYLERNMIHVYLVVWEKYKRWFIMSWVCAAVMWFPFA